MRNILIVISIVAVSAPVFASESVRGHYRRDGTYVQPHHRSSPNDSRLDNWSSQGNTNPYTGRQGTVDPYRAPDPSSPRSSGFDSPRAPSIYDEPRRSRSR